MCVSWQLTEIEYNMSLGKNSRDVPADADSEQLFLKVWKNMVLGLQRERRGDSDGAFKAYRLAEKLGSDEHCWFADIANMRMEALAAAGKRTALKSSEDSDDKKVTAADAGSRKTGTEDERDILLKKRKKRR